MTTAFIGYGCAIGYSSDGSSYTALANVLEITPPTSKTTSVEITNMGSPSSRKEFRPGLLDEDELALKLVYDKTQMAALRALLQVIKYWKFTASDLASTASTLVAQGFIMELGNEAPLDDKITITIKIKFTGLATFTAGT